MQNKFLQTEVCTATITVKGSMMKQYGGNTFYLKNGQEFEIQLNNNTKDVVAAKILMNGKPISQSRLILKPGQKVHLDRYIDEAKRFKFETYEVDNTQEAIKAIEDNGTITIMFYREKPAPTPTPYTPIYYTTGLNNQYFQNSMSFMGEVATSYSGQHTNSVKSLKSRGLAGGASGSIETGRVEKGSDSKQKFKDYVGEFEYSPFQTVSVKILPVQYKPMSVSVLAEYCVQCGTKNKKGNYKFCPRCGTKY